MRRRDLLRTIACVLVAGPQSAAAQRTRLPRVVMIVSADEATGGPFGESFRKGLRESGHVEGRTLVLELRYGRLDPARLATLMRAAVAEQPDVLVVTGLALARDARDLTATIPVVVATSSDLVDAGIVRSFARPGGNITGISDLVDEAAVKRLELLRAALPQAKRVALLTDPHFPATPKIERRIEAVAPQLGFTITKIHASDRASLYAVIDAMAQSRPDALLLGGSPLFNSPDLIERATAVRVPVIHYWQGTGQQGALVSYEADVHDNFRRAAGYVDRILKGSRPADLPIHQPTQYKLVVNARTAKSLGFDVPLSLLQRADEVIR